ncbi:zf-HC2 domain-containing protein [Jeongeupia naejangsanensis]|uniref:Zf-HC2 domain-containing protein n=1 Tax=Jeongeupia naejangsanensis TaxID=613195 RepID=A0ABS2BNQ7_9NEIS|nr:zf-HC2 domain-containing protein [Jeongeupia naejangsanensis]MBM3117254.1 zf-HC2 domain-containing protein [Jeongeupia naejangsanensis]
MANCKTVSKLLSDALDRPLSPHEWLVVHAHLPICSGCRNFRRQVQMLKQAGDRLRGGRLPEAPPADD